MSPAEVAAIVDPYERVAVAREQIDLRLLEISAFGRTRAETVAALLAQGVRAVEIGRRLDMHPNYVTQLARRARASSPDS